MLYKIRIDSEDKSSNINSQVQEIEVKIKNSAWNVKKISMKKKISIGAVWFIKENMIKKQIFGGVAVKKETTQLDVNVKSIKWEKI